jgi:hypothetical protein
LKKRSKKLLLTGGCGSSGAKARRKQKFFCFFFFKKRSSFLTLRLFVGWLGVDAGFRRHDAVRAGRRLDAAVCCTFGSKFI